jgi:hypothetical protein
MPTMGAPDDYGDRSEPGEAGTDRGVNAERDLTLDPERADEPHGIEYRESPFISEADERSDDPFVDEETVAAGAEAASLGGRVASDDDDPAMAPVRQAGGGEAEGFEESEEELIDNAEHGDFAPDPYDEAFPEESESDLSGAEYGEADHERDAERDSDLDSDW